jgi:hypothetical protein
VILTAVEMDGGAPAVPPAEEPEPAVELESAAEPESAVEPEPAEEPVAVVPDLPEVLAADPPPRRPRFARLRAFLRGPEPAGDSPAVDPPREADPPPVGEAPPAAETPSAAEPPPAPEDPAGEGSGAQAALAAALDSLGQAHHRPYSRA